MSKLPALARPGLVTSAPTPVPRPQVAVAADGRRAVIADGAGARQLDLATGATLPLLGGEPARFAACFRDETWVIGARLARFDRAGAAIGEPIEIPAATAFAAVRGVPAVVADDWTCARTREGVTVAPRAGTGIAAFPIDERGVVEQRADGVWLRRGGGDTQLAVPPAIASGARLAGATLVFGGTSVVLEMTGRGGHYLLVTRLRGGLVWRLRLEDVVQVAIGEHTDRAVALVGDGELVEIDLRLGRPLRTQALAHASCAIGVDGTGQHVVVAGNAGEITTLAFGDAPRRRSVTEILPAPAPAADAAPGALPDGAVASTAATPVALPDIAVGSSAAEDRAVASAPDVAPPGDPDDLERDRDRAIRGILAHVRLRRLEHAAPAAPLADDDRAHYLADWRALVVAWCRRAAAEAWDRGRITDDRGPLPFATELDALLDAQAGRAPDRVVAARTAEATATLAFAHWADVADAPHAALARELSLSPLAILALQVASAPALWGELARAFAIVGNDPARAACDELTIAHLLGLDDVRRASLARELDAGAPLVAHGIVQLGAGRRPFREIVVAPAIVRRLAGEPPPDGEPGLVVAHAGVPDLAALRLPPGAIELVSELSRPGPAVRIVLAGRAGSGRRTLAAALAARADRTLGTVDVTAHTDEAHLVSALQGAHHRGWIACVSGLDRVEDPALRARLDAAIARHPGCVIVRATDGQPATTDATAIALDLPVPALPARATAWREVLADAGRDPSAAPELAARFAVGAGTMHRAVARLAPGDATTPGIAAAIRGLRASKIGTIATRVPQLAAWDAVVLPPEIGEAARDFVARVRHRSTVLDGWGLGAIAQAARGATALLQGGPGTGKTLLAGAIAKDLGFELYRVDLSRVMSKWLGETEKNLAAVFDAAEEGECVLLFDEADALFTKRTEVKSSNDRYANVEVDYLLQRLDAFTGVAVLTTNFGTSIDPAFRRRLALNVTLPFPDVEQRAALWRAHLPAGVPIAADLDVAALATRYPMSGGYIRNAALRAAFRAAERGTGIDGAGLVAAIEAEYRDGGRLDAVGVLQ